MLIVPRTGFKSRRVAWAAGLLGLLILVCSIWWVVTFEDRFKPRVEQRRQEKWEAQQRRSQEAGRKAAREIQENWLNSSN